MVKGATILRVSRAVDFTNGANIPLAVNADMAEVVAFKVRLVVAWMVTVKETVYRYSLNSPFRQDFMVQLCVLDGQFDGGSEGKRRSGGYSLWIGHRNQFGGIVFYICYKFWHMELVEKGKEVFLDGLLNSPEGVATSADTGGGRGKVEEST